MLYVQEFLMKHGVEALQSKFGITVNYHPTLPIAIFNYSQIDSPKLANEVMECRGLVLELDTFDVVAKSFNRFFNLGEAFETQKNFKWDEFVALDKEDGSLILLYNYDNKWMMNTRNSWGDGIVNFTGFTWKDLFLQAVGCASLEEFGFGLDKTCCYTFELVSPYNKVVRKYDKPEVYLINVVAQVYHSKLGEYFIDEYSPREVVAEARCLLGLQAPKLHEMGSISEVHDFIKEKEKSDPTFEGLVLVEDRCSPMRIKVKSSTYVALHRLKGNDNIFNPRHLVPLVVSAELDEVATYFPEVLPKAKEYKAKIDAAFEQMMEVWNKNKDEQYQKNFALGVKGQTPFTSILFEARKKGVCPSELWRDSVDLIVKVLF